MKGVSINSAGIKDFKLPKTEVYYKVPGWIARPFAKLIHFRPFIKEKDCKKCNICKASCPVDAITITDKTSCIDEAKCVKCFCCHEVCPYDAIYIMNNMIAKMIWQYWRMIDACRDYKVGKE